MKSYLAYMHIWKQLPWDVALSHSQSLSCGGYRDYKYLTLHNQEGKQADWFGEAVLGIESHVKRTFFH